MSSTSPDRDAIEREVKLEVDPTFVLPSFRRAAPGLSVTELADQFLDATYFDTETCRLLDQGITVRRRTGEGRTRWTAKLPATEAVIEGGVVRRELDIDVDDVAVPAPLADLVGPHVGGAALGPVARLRSHRRRLTIAGDDGVVLVEVDDDTVTAEGRGSGPGAGAVVTFREVEVEFDSESEATAELVRVLMGELMDAGARPGDRRSKVERALALLGRR